MAVSYTTSADVTRISSPGPFEMQTGHDHQHSEDV